VKKLTDRKEEVLEKMRNNPKGWRFQQLRGLLEHFGFDVRQPSGGGSHAIFSHPDLDYILSIPRARPIKEFYVKQAVKAVDNLFEKWRHEDDL